MAENFGNDFVQAYMNGVQLRLAREKQNQEQERQAALLPLEQERLKREIALADQQHKESVAQMGYKTEELKTKMRDMFNSGAIALQPTLQNATSPGRTDVQLNPVNSVQPQQTASFTQGPSTVADSAPESTQFVNVDPRIAPEGFLKIEGVSGPDAMARQSLKKKAEEFALEANKAGLIEQAKFPVANELNRQKSFFEMQKDLAIEGAKATNAETLRTAQDKAALERVKATGGYQIQSAYIRAAADRYNTDHKSAGANADPEVLADNATLAMTGHSDIPAGNLKLKSVIKNFGGVPFSTKDAEKLKALSDVKILYGLMADKVAELPDDKISAMFDRVAAKVPGSDAYNFRQAVFGKAANISHTYGGEIGRLSDPDVARAMGTLVEPGITKQEGIKRLNVMHQETSSKVLNHILSGIPVKQQLMILQDQQIDPTQYVISTSQGPKAKFKQDKASGSWGVYDPKVGKYEVIE